MPDTKILRQAPHQWIDVDDPNTIHPVRRLARAARRQRRLGTTPQAPVQHVAAAVAPLTQVNQAQPVHIAPAFSPLQEKLIKRLVTRQGVSETDAKQVVANNGYNKAASYGHMRAAGANHPEASLVISLGSPEVSLAYGIGRAQGMTHTDSLAKALIDYDD